MYIYTHTYIYINKYTHTYIYIPVNAVIQFYINYIKIIHTHTHAGWYSHIYFLPLFSENA